MENASSRKNSEEKINPRKEKSYRKDALSLFLPSFNVRDRSVKPSFNRISVFVMKQVHQKPQRRYKINSFNCAHFLSLEER